MDRIDRPILGAMPDLQGQASSHKKRLIVFGTLCSIPFFLFGLLIYKLSIPDSWQEVSGPVIIYPEWKEFTPEPPLKATQYDQEIRIEFAKDYVINCATEEIRFPDGSLIVPEVEIVDEYGATYRLRVMGLDQRVIVFYYRPEGPYAGTQMPQDRVYPMLRMRSDKPIECSRIAWHCYARK